LALLETGRNRQAIPHLEAARDAEPENPDRLFYLGRAYQRAGADVQSRLLAVAPDSARAHLAIAEDHAYNGRTDLAIEEYQRTAEIDPSMPGVRGAIAELQAAGGKFAEAEKSYRQELELSPHNPTVHYRYAVVLEQLGRGDEAALHLQGAVDGDPRIVEAWAALGKALFRQKKMPQAEKALLTALSMESTPDVARTAHYQLGLLYRQTGEPDKAKEHLAAFQKLRQIENAAAEPPPEP
jgi:tetratricopeptide (TPR) repeat protein